MQLFSVFLFVGSSNRVTRNGARPVFPLLLFYFVLSLAFVSSILRVTPVFINELHYDNVGADVGEAVELAGLSGTNLQG